MTVEDDIAFLERVPVLRLLGREALRVLAIGADNRYVHGSEVLFKRGEAAEGGYVVQEGLFRLNSESDSAKETTAGPGTLLDEMALITDTKRTATATAIEPSTVVRIPRSLFLKVLQSYPDAAFRLRDVMAALVHQSEQELEGIRAALDTREQKD